MEDYSSRTRHSCMLDEIVLPQHLYSIASLPKPIEERFDLAFLHAAMLPLSKDADISDLFKSNMHEYRVERLLSLMQAITINKSADPFEVWVQLLTESVGVLDNRRLFTNEHYQAYQVDNYRTLKFIE